MHLEMSLEINHVLMRKASRMERNLRIYRDHHKKLHV